jgi:hypothetical protein
MSGGAFAPRPVEANVQRSTSSIKLKGAAALSPDKIVGSAKTSVDRPRDCQSFRARILGVMDMKVGIDEDLVPDGRSKI